MRIVEDTQVFELGGIGGANLARLHFELRLSQAPTLHEYLICSAPTVSVSVHAVFLSRQRGDGPECDDVRGGERSSASIMFCCSGSAC